MEENKKPRYLISACLTGQCCRYDAGAFHLPHLVQLVEEGIALPFCPECAGGLPTPRPPCEIKNGEVLTATGHRCTSEYQKGAQMALQVCRENGITAAILKENSPSCGATHVYDGTHTGTLRAGKGVTAALLAENGITLYTEKMLPKDIQKEL